MGAMTIYTDGGCSGNPGPGGWAAVLVSGEARTVLSGGERETTNNRMELTAVIRALKEAGRRLPPGSSIDVFTDSQYVKKGMTEWIGKWRANGWINSARDPVKNRDLWEELLSLANTMHVGWHWIKGHAENEYNNLCDAMVRKEIAQFIRS